MLVGDRSPLGLYDLQLIIGNLAKAWQICTIFRITLIIEQLEVVQLCIQLSCFVACVTRADISRIRWFCSINTTVTRAKSSYYSRARFSSCWWCVLHTIILSWAGMSILVGGAFISNKVDKIPHDVIFPDVLPVFLRIWWFTAVFFILSVLRAILITVWRLQRKVTFLISRKINLGILRAKNNVNIIIVQFQSSQVYGILSQNWLLKINLRCLE